MSHFLFVDESGQDQRESPYEVLAGVSVEDRMLWSLVQAIQQDEFAIFGRRYSEGVRELKAKRLLDRRTYIHAAQLPTMGPEERRALAKRCLDDGPHAGRREITAPAQAKLVFVLRALERCAQFNCRIFASAVPANAPRTAGDFLRRDYAYLFERFFYFLEDLGPNALGLVVFDEIERSKSHILISQMARYFLQTERGRLRAGRIIPEPMFVHSELTTGVQLADLVAYIIAWNVRVGSMELAAREEMAALGGAVQDLRYRAVREVGDNPSFGIWSIAVIDDLRPFEERLDVLAARFRT